jgi:hypothetical protein
MAIEPKIAVANGVWCTQTIVLQGYDLVDLALIQNLLEPPLVLFLGDQKLSAGQGLPAQSE